MKLVAGGRCAAFGDLQPGDVFYTAIGTDIHLCMRAFDGFGVGDPTPRAVILSPTHIDFGKEPGVVDAADVQLAAAWVLDDAEFALGRRAEEIRITRGYNPQAGTVFASPDRIFLGAHFGREILPLDLETGELFANWELLQVAHVECDCWEIRVPIEQDFLTLVSNQIVAAP